MLGNLAIQMANQAKLVATWHSLLGPLSCLRLSNESCQIGLRVRSTCLTVAHGSRGAFSLTLRAADLPIGLGWLHGLGVRTTQTIRVVLSTVHVGECLTLHLLLSLLLLVLLLLLGIELLGTALALLGCLACLLFLIALATTNEAVEVVGDYHGGCRLI